MKTKLGWPLRTTTTTIAKLPPNQKNQGTKMTHKVAYLVKTYDVLTSLMINTYQTWIHIVLTCREITWEKKGSKAIHVFGVEDFYKKILLQYPLHLMEVHYLYKSLLQDHIMEYANATMFIHLNVHPQIIIKLYLIFSLVSIHI